MPAPEFSFDIRLSGGAFEDDHKLGTPVLVDLFRHVLGHAGVKGEASDRLVDQVMAEYRKGPAAACMLRFTAHAGEMEIVLVRAGRDFRTSCPVPIR